MKAVNVVKDVIQELLKVKWPELREATIITLVVIVATGFAGLLFLLVDSAVYKIIKLLLGIGR